jgi:hypothetical protein
VIHIPLIRAVPDFAHRAIAFGGRLRVNVAFKRTSKYLGQIVLGAAFLVSAAIASSTPVDIDEHNVTCLRVTSSTTGDFRLGSWDDLSPEQQRLFETFVIRNYPPPTGGNTRDLAKNIFNRSSDHANGSAGSSEGLLTQSQLTSFIGTTSLFAQKGVIRELASIGEIFGDEVAGHQFRIRGELVNNTTSVQAIKSVFSHPIAGSGHGLYAESNREQGLLGKPNGQVSRVPDGTGVEIDVDYRCILCSGHLDPDNSDIRAGTHYEDHVQRYGQLPPLTKLP